MSSSSIYVSKEERRERELERQALQGSRLSPYPTATTSTIIFPTSSNNNARHGTSPAFSSSSFASLTDEQKEEVQLQHEFFSQQRLRVEVYEHQMRNSLVTAEAHGWTQRIENPWRYSDLSVRLQLKAVEESETTWRAAVLRETSLTMDRLYKVLNRVFEDAVAQFRNADVESGDQQRLRIEEREFRKMVHEHYIGAAAVAVLQTIEPEERAWRGYIFRDFAEASKKLWSVVLGAQFLWLLSPAGGAGGILSEAEARQRILRQEWFSRAAAAIRFCQLQLQWHEEWQRMTRLFSEKINFQYTRLAFRIWTDELNERRALFTLYQPFAADIREQVEENENRKRRMENKLTALKNLRSVELARSSASRFEGDDYVAVWRSRELSEIEALHNQILMSVAQFYTGKETGEKKQGGGGGMFDNNDDDDVNHNNVSPSPSGMNRRRNLGESPSLQKLRAFAASLSPSRNNNNNNASPVSSSSVVKIIEPNNSSENNNNNNNNISFFHTQENIRTQILKLDQALIDLHGHHEDVMTRLANPTTAFDEIVQYRKVLQAKSGPKLSAKAEMEVKQLKGALDAEIANFQKHSSLRRRQPLQYLKTLKDSAREARDVVDDAVLVSTGNASPGITGRENFGIAIYDNRTNNNNNNNNNNVLSSENLQQIRGGALLFTNPQHSSNANEGRNWIHSESLERTDNHQNNKNKNINNRGADGGGGGARSAGILGGGRGDDAERRENSFANSSSSPSSPVYDDDNDYYYSGNRQRQRQRKEGEHHYAYEDDEEENFDDFASLMQKQQQQQQIRNSSENVVRNGIGENSSLEAIRNWCISTATSHITPQ